MKSAYLNLKKNNNYHTLTTTQREIIKKLRASPYFIRKIEAIYTLNDFRIQNERGHNVLKRTEQVGEIADDVATPMPAGIYSCFLSKCSHAGIYEVEIIFAEVY